MKRQVLFRGKLTHTGGWVYGYYWSMAEYNHYIMNAETGESHNHEVMPETVGQFTGLTDKNGTKIFEGDILTYKSHDPIVVDSYNGCFINSNTYITLHTEIKDPISRQISFEITSNIHDDHTA